MEIGEERESIENNNVIVANKQSIAVSIAVQGNYWYSKKSRTEAALSNLFRNLYDPANAAIRTQAAEQVWQAIKKNPKSPAGPLTLAAISQAILTSCHFENPADRRAFFVFMQHNMPFQKLFLSAIFSFDNVEDKQNDVRQLFALPIIREPGRVSPHSPAIPEATELYALDELDRADDLQNDPDAIRLGPLNSNLPEVRAVLPEPNNGLVAIPPHQAIAPAPRNADVEIPRLVLPADHANLLPLEFISVDADAALRLNDANPNESPLFEIDHLLSVWFRAAEPLHHKITSALTNGDFIRDLFEYAPAVADQLGQQQAQQLIMRCPEVIGVALRHPESNLNARLGGLLYKQNPQDTQIAVESLLIDWLYKDQVHAADLVGENEAPVREDDKGKEEDLPQMQFPQQAGQFTRYYLTSLFSPNGFPPLGSEAFIDHVSQLKRDQPNAVMPVVVAKVMRDALLYFTHFRMGAVNEQIHINNIISNIAAGRYSEENYHQYCELRYCLYHPDCIKIAANFWSANVYSFKLAAGEQDEFLAHLISNMPDPIAFVSQMLSPKQGVSETADDKQNRLDYFSQRLAKIMPVLGKIPGKNASKARNRLLRMNVNGSDGSSTTVLTRLQTEVNKLIDAYGGKPADPDNNQPGVPGNFKDPQNRLLAVLDDDFTRGKCQLTTQQIAKLLSQDPADPLSRVNTRFEIIIAHDDFLWRRAESALPYPLDNLMQRAKYPYLTARIDLERDMKKGLMSFIEVESTNYTTFISELRGKNEAERKALETRYRLQPGHLTMHKAYFIASKEKLWRQINPQDRYPVLAFIHSLVPNLFPKLTNFFEEKERQLVKLNPIFAMRLSWDKLTPNLKQQMTFEQYMAREQGTHVLNARSELMPEGIGGEHIPIVLPKAKTEFAGIIADVSRGDTLLDTYSSQRILRADDPIEVIKAAAEESLQHQEKAIADAAAANLKFNAEQRRAKAKFKTSPERTPALAAKTRALLASQQTLMAHHFIKFLELSTTILVAGVEAERGELSSEKWESIWGQVTSFTRPISEGCFEGDQQHESGIRTVENPSLRGIQLSIDQANLLGGMLQDLVKISDSLHRRAFSKDEFHQIIAEQVEQMYSNFSRVSGSPIEKPPIMPDKLADSLAGVAQSVKEIAKTQMQIAADSRAAIFEVFGQPLVANNVAAEVVMEEAPNQPKHQHSDFELKLLENPSRLEAFLVEVNTSARVAATAEFIESIDIENGLERPGTVTALTVEQVFRFLTMSEPPTNPQRDGNEFAESHKLAQRLILKKPELISKILLHKDPAVIEKLPYALNVLQPVIMQILERPHAGQIFTPEVLFALLKVPALSGGVSGRDFFKQDIALLRRLLQGNELQQLSAGELHNDIVAIISNPVVMSQLTARDLLRIGEINPATFDSLVNGSPSLRQKLLSLDLDDLPKDKLLGFSELFKREPESLLAFIGKLSFEQINELVDFDADIFRLASNEGQSRHPLYDVLVEDNAVCSPELILNCVHSDYEPLKQLMHDMLRALPLERSNALLTEVILHPDCQGAAINFLINPNEHNQGAGVLASALHNPQYIREYLSCPEDGPVDNRIIRLWSKLTACDAVNNIISNDNIFHNRADVNALLIQHQNFLNCAKKPSPKADVKLRAPASTVGFRYSDEPNEASTLSTQVGLVVGSSAKK